MTSPQLTEIERQHLKIIYAYAKKTLDIEINLMILRKPNGEILGNAKGRIQFNEKERIIVTVDACDFPVRELAMINISNSREGAYHTDEQMITAEGELDNGLSFKTSPMNLAQWAIGNDAKQILTPRDISFKTEGSNNTYSRLTLIDQDRVFLNPNLDMRPKTNDEINDRFPIACGEFSLTSGNYQWRAKDNIKYIFTATKQETETDQTEIENSLLLAMSFVGGNKLKKRAVFESGLTTKTTLYSTSNDKGSTFFSPITFVKDNDAGYNMVCKLQSFLKEKVGTGIDSLVEMFCFLRLHLK